MFAIVASDQHLFSFSFRLICFQSFCCLVPKHSLEMQPLIIAIGLETEHWQQLCHRHPACFNCMIHVSGALKKERDEPTIGTGYDSVCAERIKAKPAYTVVKEVATEILQRFGLLIVACKHGTHRSVVLARHVQAGDHSSRLLTPCCRCCPTHCCPSEFMMLVQQHMINHSLLHGPKPHPLLNIGILMSGFDGQDWLHQCATENWNSNGAYHVAFLGDIAIEYEDPTAIDSHNLGWAIGTLLTRDAGGRRNKYYPRSYVRSLPFGYFGGRSRVSVKNGWDRMVFDSWPSLGRIDGTA